jgi:hypothetical protein
MFPRGNLLSAATIRQGMPEVKLRHQQVQITVPSENTAVNEMTSATLLKIEGISGVELHPHRDGL